MRAAVILKMFVAVPLIPVLVVCTLWGYAYWPLVVLAGVLLYYPIQQLGQSIGYHKLFAHRAFTPRGWYPYVAAFIASVSFYGDPLSSAMVHRIHHRYSDLPKDPHSPTKGRFHAYLGWMWAYTPDVKDARCVADLLRDYPWMQKFRRYEWLLPWAFHMSMYLLSPAVSCAFLIAGFLSINNGLLVNAFSHNTKGEALDTPWLARLVNPIFLHKHHHDNGNLLDYSHNGVTDFWARFAMRFLASTK